MKEPADDIPDDTISEADFTERVAEEETPAKTTTPTTPGPARNSKNDPKKSMPLPPKKPHLRKSGPPRAKKKTQAEKRQRQSGKNTDKPYISSSMGDMCRLMIRMACTENTLNMTDPPPVEFYDYWHKFKQAEGEKTKEKLPYQYVDTRKFSVPRIKMNTSSYDIMAKAALSSPSLHVIDSGGKKMDAFNKLAPTLSELWKNVRLSLSTESFISSSTKVSEEHENVKLESGWSSDDEDDLQALLSDEDDTAESKTSIPGVEYAGPRTSGIARPSEASKSGGAAVRSAGSSTSLVSGLDMDLDDGKDEGNKELGAMAGSLLRMGLKDARHHWEHAVHIGKYAKTDVIDHFMEDLDDSFLIDAISYGMLPDSAFVPTFDYFNEDPLYKARELERERLEWEAANKKGKKKGGAVAEIQKLETKIRGRAGAYSDTTLGVTDGEETEEEEWCSETKTVDPSAKGRDDYATCLAKQKKRIEDKILAAVKCRTAMGDYIVPEGGQPLAETFADAGPGPAAYTPKINAIKPSPVGVILAPRWSNSIYETPGPGPAAYFPNCRKCTGEMLNLHFSPRFEKSETVGPGPGHYDVLKNTSAGKDKPHARIISRLPPEKVGCGNSRYVNIFGFNQFGKRHPPSALLISKHILRDRTEVTQRPGVGPGSYDSPVFKDTRIGITIKSRIPRIGEADDSPNFVDLPPLIGSGPGVTMASRKFTNIEPQSPGPIYQVLHPPPRPVSMTFKPFPRRGLEDEPSPIHYGIGPGDQHIKTKPRAPNPIIYGSHNLRLGNEGIPGPEYLPQPGKCVKGITLVGRPKDKVDTSPGPYLIRDSVFKGLRAVFQGKWFVKEVKIPPKCTYFPDEGDENPLDICAREFATPKDVTHRITGGLMSGRWAPKGDGRGWGEGEISPGFQNVFGLTNRGPYSKIPLSLKSRHSPFVYMPGSKTAPVPANRGKDSKLPMSFSSRPSKIGAVPDKKCYAKLKKFNINKPCNT